MLLKQLLIYLLTLLGGQSLLISGADLRGVLLLFDHESLSYLLALNSSLNFPYKLIRLSLSRWLLSLSLHFMSESSALLLV